jgi:hypothetical protein
MIFFTPNYLNTKTKKQLREDKVQSQDLPANKSDTIKVVLQLGKPRPYLGKLWALLTQNPLIYT